MPDNQIYQEYVTQRLLTVALETALPMAITPNCRAQLTQHINDGVQTQWVSQAAPPVELRLFVAEANIRRLVALMQEEARKLGRNDLGENTLFAAMKGLCPFWPIC